MGLWDNGQVPSLYIGPPIPAHAEGSGYNIPIIDLDLLGTISCRPPSIEC